MECSVGGEFADGSEFAASSIDATLNLLLNCLGVLVVKFAVDCELDYSGKKDVSAFKFADACKLESIS